MAIPCCGLSEKMDIVIHKHLAEGWVVHFPVIILVCGICVVLGEYRPEFRCEGCVVG